MVNVVSHQHHTQRTNLVCRLGQRLQPVGFPVFFSWRLQFVEFGPLAWERAGRLRRGENRWLIIIICAGFKCRDYIVVQYSGYFKSPQVLKMLLCDFECHYSQAAHDLSQHVLTFHSAESHKERKLDKQGISHGERIGERLQYICVSIQPLSLACLRVCVCVCVWALS